MAAGALAGGAGSLAVIADHVLPVQLALYLFAQLMLIGLGLYLLGMPRALSGFERAGGRLWRRVAPLAGPLLPADTAPRAFALGTLWGWLPCGLVYSVLATALLTGNARHGALVMGAFGLGTLPNLMAAGMVLRRLAARGAAATLRRIGGSLVIALGLWGVAHAGTLGEGVIAGVFCLAR
jgi:hypothetical protein